VGAVEEERNYQDHGVSMIVVLGNRHL
jgi:hypothetical protein